MRRPTILVAEPEPSDALSTRKLVLETAKFNVLTAHSNAEAIEFFQAFPNVDAVVVAEGDEISCGEVGSFIAAISNKTPIIGLSARQGFFCRSAQHQLSSHDPEGLVQLLRSMFGDPRDIDQEQSKLR